MKQKRNWERHEENPNKNQTSVTIVIPGKIKQTKVKEGKMFRTSVPF